MCFYVGCTKRRLKDRLSEHKYAIRTQNEDYPMAKHFKEVHQSNDSLLRIEGLESIQMSIRGGDWLRRPLQRETFLIFKLR